MPVTVTTSWDDGHVLDMRVAALLREYGLQGTFYVAPKSRDLTVAERLSAEQIAGIGEDFEVGCHTLTHCDLRTVDSLAAAREIAQGQSYLEDILGKPVTSFAYPYGHYTDAARATLRRLGITYARTTREFESRVDDPLRSGTTIHAYSRRLNAISIARLAGYRPKRAIEYRDWRTLAEELFRRSAAEGAIFHLWGHSWEIERHDDWRRLESLLAFLAEQPGIAAATNSGLVRRTRPRRLLVACAHFHPRVGGLERYALEMCKGAVRKGYDVTVVSSGDGRRVQCRTTEDGFKEYRLPTQFHVLNTPVSLKWYWQIRRIIAAERPDVVNVHMPVPFLPDLTVLASKGRPVVVNYHSGSIKKGSVAIDVMATAYERFVLPVILRRADSIICSSRFVREKYLGRYLHKSQVVYPGVDTTLFRKAAHATEGSNVLFIGDFTYEGKGLHCLREAIRELPGVTLRVVGRGRAIPAERVEYVGELSGEDLVREIQQSSVLVLPTSQVAEGFGMVLLEGMACGIPVIASNIGGVPEVVEAGHDGILVTPGDVSELATAISSILSDSSYAARLAERAYEKVVARFTWGVAVASYLESLDAVVRRTSGSATRVLIVGAEYPPHVQGGLGVHYSELAGALGELTPVTMIAARTSRTVPANERKGDLLVRRVLIPARFPLNHLVFGLKAWLLAARTPCDVVHLCVPYGLLNAAFKKKPTVAKVHFLYAGQGGSFIYQRVVFPIASLIDRYMIDRSDFIMTTSEFMRQALVATMGVTDGKVGAIPNGIGDQWLALGASGEELKGPNEHHSSFTILNVGRFVPRKGTLELLMAFKKLHVAYPTTRLVLVGEGYREGAKYAAAAMAFIASSNLQAAVHVTGWLDSEEVMEYYANADLYVHAATYEPFGNVILEAMATGLPVIAVRAGGPEEVAGGSAMILDTNDPELLASAMASFIEDPAMTQKFRRLSLERVKAFSWAATAKATLEGYEGLLTHGS